MATIEEQLQQYKDQLDQIAQRPSAPPTGSPDDGSRRSWTGLLGGVLGGGQAPGYQLRGSEADTSGNRALLNFGIQTLLASGPAPVRPDLLSALATGLQGAQSSTDLDQRRAQAAALAQYNAGHQQQQDRLAALKEALPLLKMQQEAAALAGLKGNTSSTATAGDGGFTGDKAKDLAIIAKRESGGDPTAINYVMKEDPTAYERGATASGKYQIVNSTWAEGMKLAGLDPSKYVTARSAPESVQDQVAGALYDKYGSKPWVKGARDWVKDESGKYQLATVRPQAAPAAPGTPAPYQVAGPALPPPGAAPAAPGGTVKRETQVRGADGVVRTVVQNVPATPAPAVEPETGLPVTSVPAVAPGATPPGVTPPPAGVTPPPAAAPPPAMAAPPPFVMRPLTPTEAAATSYDLDPATEKSLQERLQSAVTVPEGLAAKAARDAALIARRQAADTERLRIEATERTAHNTRWEKQQEQAAAIAAAKLKEEGELARLHAGAAETRLTNKEAVVNQANQDGFKQNNKELAHAIVVERQMEGFRSLSENVGTPGWMNTTKFPGSDASISERLQQLGVPQDDLAGFQQLKQGMVDITRTLREGVQMGAMSDKDLDFIQRMGPTEWMDKDTRLAAIDYIQKAYRAKRRFAVEVNSELSRGTNYGDALSKANEKVKDFVPMVPPELADNFDNPNVQSAERLAWARRENVRPGTLFHFPNGDVRIMRRPPPKKEGG